MLKIAKHSPVPKKGRHKAATTTDSIKKMSTVLYQKSCGLALIKSQVTVVSQIFCRHKMNQVKIVAIIAMKITENNTRKTAGIVCLEMVLTIKPLYHKIVLPHCESTIHRLERTIYHCGKRTRRRTYSHYQPICRQNPTDRSQ